MILTGDPNTARTIAEIMVPSVATLARIALGHEGGHVRPGIRPEAVNQEPQNIVFVHAKPKTAEQGRTHLGG
jgi:hypothetical protein